MTNQTNQWYFRVGDEELGPVTFRELVELVRCGVIGDRDFVRSFWNETPQRVESVIGLLYMSRQPPVATLEQTETPQTVVDQLAAVEIEERGDRNERPEWLQRLLELQTSLNSKAAFQGAPTDIRAEPSDTGTGEPAEDSSHPAEIEYEPDREEQTSAKHLGQGSGSGGSAEWDATMGAALSHLGQEQTAPKKLRGFVWSTSGRILGAVRNMVTSERFLSRMFRVGSMIGVAAVVGMSVEQWSLTESKRFPGRSGQLRRANQPSRPGQENAEVQIRIFPWIGKCTSSEYLLLSVNAMLLSGLGAYGIAAFLESRIDD